ncbi:MAG: hypothetical protein U1F43_12325 [Myxococcota bacterium]
MPALARLPQSLAFLFACAAAALGLAGASGSARAVEPDPFGLEALGPGASLEIRARPGGLEVALTAKDGAPPALRLTLLTPRGGRRRRGPSTSCPAPGR